MGDATALVITLAGELLKKAEQLINLGLHPSEILGGYELAREKALQELESESRLPESIRSHELMIILYRTAIRPVRCPTFYSTHCRVVGFGPSSMHRIEAVWTRRHLGTARCTSSIPRSAAICYRFVLVGIIVREQRPRLEGLQRRQCPRCQDHGRCFGRLKSGTRNAFQQRA